MPSIMSAFCITAVIDMRTARATSIATRQLPIADGFSTQCSSFPAFFRLCERNCAGTASLLAYAFAIRFASEKPRSVNMSTA
ncbi:hypothetical protein [Burkholderia vietnamiensis]|uniref:hypothetical protein n=1 Tax=Burkholderia vietnamiensis TaxID=60552 RepID=UPI001F5EAAE5|nr:hypothetical protein [Burkholderia vietnamiensis]